MPTSITDLPDDCILVFLALLTIPELISLQMTCKRMAYATRLRAVWYPIYQQLLQLIPMPPLPPPYDTLTIDDVPTIVLEKMVAYTYQLHLRLTQPLPSPIAVKSLVLPEPKEIWNEADLRLLPGGRWLLEVQARTGRVHLRDLWNPETNGQVIICRSFEPADEIIESTTSVSLFQGNIQVFWHAVQWQNSALLTYKSRTSLLSIPLSTPGCDVVKPHSHAMPDILDLPASTSPIDTNGTLISFHVHEQDYIFVLDWSYEDRDNQDSVRGVIICSSLSGNALTEAARTWTRVLVTKDQSYLACITAAGEVFLYTVPPLSVVKSPRELPRVQLAPIAHVLTPSSGVGDVSNWSASIPDSHDVQASHYTLTIWTLMSIYTVAFSPSRVFLSSDYNHTPTLHRSALCISGNAQLPVATDKLFEDLVVGPSGTRAVYVERTRHPPYHGELAVFSGPLLRHVPTSRIDDDNLNEARTLLPSSVVSRRLVLPGLALTTIAVDLALDECSGTVCLRQKNGIVLFLFAPHINSMFSSSV